MSTVTSRDNSIPQTFMECEVQKPTKEETHNTAEVAPSTYSSSIWFFSKTTVFSSSSSSSITHSTCNVFCLQRCPEEKRSSERKHNLFSLRVYISFSIKFRNGGGIRRGEDKTGGDAWGLSKIGWEETTELMGGSWCVAQGTVVTTIACNARCSLSGPTEVGFDHLRISPA